MSKRFKILSLLFVIVMLTGCVNKADYENTFKAAEEINENSYFAGYKLLEILEEDVSGYDIGYNSRGVNFNKEGVAIDKGGATADIYPYGSGTLRLAWFVLNSDEFHLFGYKVGDNAMEAAEHIEEFGFKLNEKDSNLGEYGEISSNYGILVLEKLHITIYLYSDDDQTISSIRIVVADPKAPHTDMV